jgi:hypothetical protein
MPSRVTSSTKRSITEWPMSMMFKRWKRGTADKPWKLDIAERDLKLFRDAISHLCYVLSPQPIVGFPAQLAYIRSIDVKKAADALAQYNADLADTIEEASAAGVRFWSGG